MAGVASVNLSVSVSGLGKATHTLPISFTGAVPTVVTPQYRLLAAETEEALPLGDVTTIEGILIIASVCNDGEIQVDTSYVDSFNAEIKMAEGEAQYFKPAGAVYIRNDDDAAGAYEYLIFGTA